MDNKQLTKKGANMSMIGVKAKINEEYEIHIRDFERVYKDVYGRKTNYNPFMGYDSLGQNFKKPNAPLNRSESVLYGTWKVLKFIEDLRPDLKKNPIDRGAYVN